MPIVRHEEDAPLTEAAMLTLAELRAWAEALPPGEVAGLSNSATHCPIGQAVNALLQLSESQYLAVDGEGITYDLPDGGEGWATLFNAAGQMVEPWDIYDQIDALYPDEARPVTREQFLAILAQCEASTSGKDS